MRSRLTVIFALCLLIIVLFPQFSRSEEFSVNLGDQELKLSLNNWDETEQDWRLSFDTNGKLWFWWSTKRDTMVTWDYGASILMEIARGKGHRVWYGGAYRLSAGFDSGQTITPFDPYQADTWLYFSWRYTWNNRHKVFLYARRTCYHLMDLHYSSAVFWTHAAFGFGTTSPAELSEVPQIVKRKKRGSFNGYISTGPFIHGGPDKMFGDAQVYQWETSFNLSYTYPIANSLLIQTQITGDMLILSETEDEQNRYRATIRQYLIAQRKNGNLSLFVDRVLHDDYIDRWHPVAWRIGLEHLF